MKRGFFGAPAGPDPERDIGAELREALRFSPRYVLREHPEKRGEASNEARLLVILEGLFNFLSQVNFNSFSSHPEYEKMKELVDDSSLRLATGGIYFTYFLVFRFALENRYELCVSNVESICARIDQIFSGYSEHLEACGQYELFLEEQKFFQSLKEFCGVKVPEYLDNDIPPYCRI